MLFFFSCDSLVGNPFSENLCYIGTSQFISDVYDLALFCLMWGFTELNFRTHLKAIFFLYVPFYKAVFAIIYLTVILFSVIDVLSYQECFHYFFSMPVSLAQVREDTGAFYSNILAFWPGLIFRPSI